MLGKGVDGSRQSDSSFLPTTKRNLRRISLIQLDQTETHTLGTYLRHVAVFEYIQVGDPDRHQREYRTYGSTDRAHASRVAS